MSDNKIKTINFLSREDFIEKMRVNEDLRKRYEPIEGSLSKLGVDSRVRPDKEVLGFEEYVKEKDINSKV